MEFDEPKILIRRAQATDLALLGVVGPAAYAEAYAYLWGNPRAFLRQLKTFSEGAFAEHLHRETARIWVAMVNGDIVGFLTMNLGAADPVTGSAGGAEIARIYILGPASRLRLGRRLLKAAMEQALAEGAAYVWLHVMASADRARRAYLQWGFSELGRTTFTGGVAAGLSEMVVMAMPIVNRVDRSLAAR